MATGDAEAVGKAATVPPGPHYARHYRAFYQKEAGSTLLSKKLSWLVQRRRNKGGNEDKAWQKEVARALVVAKQDVGKAASALAGRVLDPPRMPGLDVIDADECDTSPPRAARASAGGPRAAEPPKPAVAEIQPAAAEPQPAAAEPQPASAAPQPPADPGSPAAPPRTPPLKAQKVETEPRTPPLKAQKDEQEPRTPPLKEPRTPPPKEEPEPKRQRIAEQTGPIRPLRVEVVAEPSPPPQREGERAPPRTSEGLPPAKRPRRDGDGPSSRGAAPPAPAPAPASPAAGPAVTSSPLPAAPRPQVTKVVPLQPSSVKLSPPPAALPVSPAARPPLVGMVKSPPPIAPLPGQIRPISRPSGGVPPGPPAVAASHAAGKAAPASPSAPGWGSTAEAANGISRPTLKLTPSPAVTAPDLTPLGEACVALAGGLAAAAAENLAWARDSAAKVRELLEREQALREQWARDEEGLTEEQVNELRQQAEKQQAAQAISLEWVQLGAGAFPVGDVVTVGWCSVATLVGMKAVVTGHRVVGGSRQVVVQLGGVADRTFSPAHLRRSDAWEPTAPKLPRVRPLVPAVAAAGAPPPKKPLSVKVIRVPAVRTRRVLPAHSGQESTESWGASDEQSAADGGWGAAAESWAPPPMAAQLRGLVPVMVTPTVAWSPSAAPPRVHYGGKGLPRVRAYTVT